MKAAQLPHLRAISHLTEVVARAASPEAILDATLEVLLDSLGADRAAVLLFDAAGVPRLRAWRNLSEQFRAAADGHSPWTPATGNPAPLVVPDVRHEPGLAPLLEHLVAEGISAELFVPLVARARLLGLFLVAFDEPHDFAGPELDLAQAVAAQAVFGIDQRQLEAELRLANATLATTLAAVPESITVQSPDGGLLFANDDAAAMLGFASPDELIAAGPRAIMERFEVFDEHGARLDLGELPGRCALRGEEPPEKLVRYRIVGTDEDRWSLVTARPVRGEDGAVRFAVNVFRDITERHQREHRERFLAAASRHLLDAGLDYQGLLERVADLFVPALADICVGRELAADGTVRHSAVRHSPAVDPAVLERALALPDHLASSPVLDELRCGRPVLLPGIADVPAPCTELARELGPESALIVPIEARGATVGAISLFRVGGGRAQVRFGPADVTLAEEVACRAGLALDSARLFTERSTVASTLQRALLPPSLPEIPGVELAARYVPAASEVGGDFYDVVPIGPGRWLITVGDVCGKGIEAASLTAMVRYTLRAFAPLATSPADLLSQVNEAVARQLGAERFCTVACGILDLPEPGTSGGPARVTLSLAGHPRPLVVGPGGSVRPVGVPGSLLGAFATADLADDEVRLEPGEALVVFTDGCIGEIPTGTDEDRLARTLGAAAGTDAAGLAAAVESAAATAVAHTDDVTVLAIRRVSAGLPTGR